MLLAELLNFTHSTVVVDIQLEGDQLHIKRELEGGWSQRVQLALPAVLAVQSGINNPRYATFKGIIAAKKKKISSVDAAGGDSAASQQVMRLYVPEQDKQTVMLSGSPGEQAAALVDKLKNEARVL